MTYTVLARRYRSREFDEVVGQEAIARTLQGAIAQGRVGHAYLFVGARGVGKTTMARLFAKALAGGSPEVDQAIMTGQDTDVIEIDAASNRGVEEARSLIANSIYAPLRGRAKVYIIDEVHMLTPESFNTLLKTLEEPPKHVKFILCTTEAQRVPATIQSRCQRFDFRNLSVGEITAHLRRVASGEGVEADADVLHAVARLAAGSMRDALSLFDRLIAAAEPGERLTHGLLERMIGLPRRQVISALVEALASGDAAGALGRCDELISSGVAMDQLLGALIERFHDLMLLAVCGEDTRLVECEPETRRELAEQSRRFDGAGLVHMIALCESVQRTARMSLAPRAMLDALIVRLAMTEKFADLAALLKAGAGSSARAEPPPKKR